MGALPGQSRGPRSRGAFRIGAVAEHAHCLGERHFRAGVHVSRAGAGAGPSGRGRAGPLERRPSRYGAPRAGHWRSSSARRESGRAAAYARSALLSAARAPRTCSRSVAPTPWFRGSCRSAIQRISAAREDRYSTTAKPTTPWSLAMTKPWCCVEVVGDLVGHIIGEEIGQPANDRLACLRSSGRQAVRAWRCMVAQRALQGIEPLRSANDPARSRRRARRRDLTRARHAILSHVFQTPSRERVEFSTRFADQSPPRPWPRRTRGPTTKPFSRPMGRGTATHGHLTRSVSKAKSSRKQGPARC